MVSYVLTALTILGSAFAIAAWLKFFGSRAWRMKQPDELGSRQFNPYIGFVEIIGNGRPDPFRTVCNSVILGLAVLVFGIPHFLVIAKFWRDRDIGASYFVHYAWTLIWWFLVLAAPCLVFVRNREAKARRLARESEH